MRPVLEEAAAAVWRHPSIAGLYPEYLIALHGVVRASVPLMEEALCRARELAPGDAVAAGLLSYLARHIEEERGHDRWLIEDLEVLGVPERDVWTRTPAESTARAVGAQYYWIRHHHPVALLGYIAVLESRPPDAAFLDRTVEATGLPASAFRTLYAHAHSDVEHIRDLEGLLDGLPLEDTHCSLVGRSSLLTVSDLTETIIRLVDDGPGAAPPRRQSPPTPG